MNNLNEEDDRWEVLRLKDAISGNCICPRCGGTGGLAPPDFTTEGPFYSGQQAARFAEAVRDAGSAFAARMGVPFAPEVVAGPYPRDGRWYVDVAWS